MESLTATVEEYLEKLFWMNEAGIERTQANLARALGVSQPTALEMVRRLVDDGFVVRDERKRLTFTAAGEQSASRIVTRHRLIEAFLMQVFGIPWDEVHEEAHSFEHGSRSACTRCSSASPPARTATRSEMPRASRACRS